MPSKANKTNPRSASEIRICLWAALTSQETPTQGSLGGLGPMHCLSCSTPGSATLSGVTHLALTLQMLESSTKRSCFPATFTSPSRPAETWAHRLRAASKPPGIASINPRDTSSAIACLVSSKKFSALAQLPSQHKSSS